MIAVSVNSEVFHNKRGPGAGYPRENAFTSNRKRAANRDVELAACLVRAFRFNRAVLVIHFAQQAALAVADVSVDSAGSHLPSVKKKKPLRCTSP